MPNPKREAQICHKIAALAYLMAEALDELNPEMSDKSSSKKHFQESSEICQVIVNNLLGTPEVATNTYLSDLSTKVDTCIRKNYKILPGLEE